MNWKGYANGQASIKGVFTVNTFTDSPPSLRLDMAPMPAAPFALRYDLQATREGQRGGLPLQSTEWEPVNVLTWEQAKEQARRIVSAIPACRWSGPHYLQGVCLVEVTEAAPFRTLSFRPAA